MSVFPGRPPPVSTPSLFPSVSLPLSTALFFVSPSVYPNSLPLSPSIFLPPRMLPFSTPNIINCPLLFPNPDPFYLFLYILQNVSACPNIFKNLLIASLFLSTSISAFCDNTTSRKFPSSRHPQLLFTFQIHAMLRARFVLNLRKVNLTQLQFTAGHADL